MSDIERALLESAARPDLGVGAAVLAEAVTSASRAVDVKCLTDYAMRLGWAAALRCIGSIVDALEIEGLASRLQPLRPPVADLDLEPSIDSARVWRNARWRVRWALSRTELANVTHQ